MKKLLLSTMLMASALGGLASQGWSRTLAGQSDWQVKKVEAETPYCTAARTFEANAVLTLAQNARGEGTVALDFQRDAFDVTRPYPVLLQVGDATRQYAIKPASSRVIILRVGNDQPLFRAMRNGSNLDVTIDNEKFSLDISGYDFAYGDLSKCLGIADPQITAQTMAPAAAGTATAAVEQNARMESLLEENKRLTQELMARDQQQQQIVEQTPSVSASEKQALVQQLADSEKRNTALLTQIQSLETNLKAANQSMNPDLSRVIQERDAQIAQLTQQNETLKYSLEQTKAQLAKLSAVSNESVAMREQLAEMENQTAALKAERDQYEAQLQVKTKEVADLNARAPEVVVKEVIKEVPAAVPDMTATDSEISRRLAEAETAAATFRAERDEYQRLLQEEKLNAKNAVKPEDNKNLIADIEKLEAEKADLMRKLAYAESRVAESATQDVEATTAEIAQLQQRLKEAQIKLGEANEKASDLERQLAQTSDQNRETAPVASDDDMAMQLKDMEQKLLTMTTEKANLEDQLSAYQDNNQTTPLKVEWNDVPAADTTPVKSPEAEKIAAKPKQNIKPANTNVAEASTPQPDVAKKQQTGGQTVVGDDIPKLVKTADIPLVGNVEKIARVSGPDFAAFRWDTGVVYGSGEQSRMADASAFETSVAKYIEKTQSRCDGQFAQNVEDMVINTISVKAADISCIDKNGKGTGASILFFTHKGMFYALAHEAGMRTFEVARDMRKRLTDSIESL